MGGCNTDSKIREPEPVCDSPLFRSMGGVFNALAPFGTQHRSRFIDESPLNAVNMNPECDMMGEVMEVIFFQEADREVSACLRLDVFRYPWRVVVVSKGPMSCLSSHEVTMRGLLGYLLATAGLVGIIVLPDVESIYLHRHLEAGHGWKNCHLGRGRATAPTDATTWFRGLAGRKTNWYVQETKGTRRWWYRRRWEKNDLLCVDGSRVDGNPGLPGWNRGSLFFFLPPVPEALQGKLVEG